MPDPNPFIYHFGNNPNLRVRVIEVGPEEEEEEQEQELPVELSQGVLKKSSKEYKRLLKLQKVREYKAPPIPGNCLGLEFEFISKSNLSKFCEMVIDSPIEEYSQVKTDNSLRPDGRYPHGLELVCCIPEKNYESKVNDILSVIKKANSSVNKSCGFHVHLDMRNRDYKLVYNNFYRCQPVLFAMHPVHRYEGPGIGDEGGFAKKSKYNTTKEAMDAETKKNRLARYKGINIASVGRHNTLEIRIHTGTINQIKVLNWLEILLAITNYDDLILHNIKSPYILCNVLNLREDLSQYIASRIDKFNNSSSLDCEDEE